MTTILDVNGKPIDLGAIREPQTESATNESRTGWLAREFDNHPGRGLTPAKLNAIMSAAEQGDIIRQLELADDIEERSGHTYAEISKRKVSVTNLSWDVLPPEGASKDEAAMTDATREWLQSVDDFEEDVLLELLDAILKGFKPIEMWWRYEERLMVPTLASRPQRWLCLNELRDGLNLRDATSYGQPLRPFNWILHQPRSRSGYPARTGLVRILALPFLFENYATRDLAEFLEIYGLPLRLGKFPTGASDAEKRKLLQAVVNIGHNAAGIIPMGMEIDFQNAAQGNEKPFDTMISAMQSIISKVVTGSTLTSGEGKHGTQALGNVHEGVRQDIVKSDAKRLSATITQQLIRPFQQLNFPNANPRRLSRFELDVPEPEDLRQYADALPKLAAVGMRIGLEDMHRRLRIPMAKEGEAILGSAAPATDPNKPADKPAIKPADKAKPDIKPADKAALAGQLPAGGGTDAIDELVAEAASDWRPVMEPMVAPLLAELDRAIERGESMAEFRARLPDMLELMDERPQAERLAKLAFQVRLMGEADIDPALRGD